MDDSPGYSFDKQNSRTLPNISEAEDEDKLYEVPDKYRLMGRTSTYGFQGGKVGVQGSSILADDMTSASSSRPTFFWGLGLILVDFCATNNIIIFTAGHESDWIESISG